MTLNNDSVHILSNQILWLSYLLIIILSPDDYLINFIKFCGNTTELYEVAVMWN